MENWLVNERISSNHTTVFTICSKHVLVFKCLSIDLSIRPHLTKSGVHSGGEGVVLPIRGGSAWEGLFPVPFSGFRCKNVSKTKNIADRYPPKLNAVDSFSVVTDNSSLEGVDTFNVTMDESSSWKEHVFSSLGKVISSRLAAATASRSRKVIPRSNVVSTCVTFI